ncbi:lipoprotein [Streptomyces sp. NBC_00638]|uniref:lipoprotein n=1 Tax=unclassified Streptomyces TaxID=2593676 RepID=UPI00224EEDAF|nr:lipoprotein [Streptomyces sp. NBC_00638]MCX5008201.1 lipoprotein [Streptomyces sp. NBC_00638]
MGVGARAGWRGLAGVALLTVVATGCSKTAEESPKASVSATPTDKASGAAGSLAKSGGTLGPAGSACELPVRFDTAEDWKPKAVASASRDTSTTGPDSSGSPEDGLAGDLADALLRQGPVSLVCEIDAKPAGNIGYLRVWTGKPGDDDADAVLKAFVTAEHGASKATYRTFEAGGLSGAEVEYVYTSELLDESKKECALAVITDDGPVVVHLGGLDTAEHTEMLPAYRLAKRTLRTI